MNARILPSVLWPLFGCLQKVRPLTPTFHAHSMDYTQVERCSPVALSRFQSFSLLIHFLFLTSSFFLVRGREMPLCFRRVFDKGLADRLLEVRHSSPFSCSLASLVCLTHSHLYTMSSGNPCRSPHHHNHSYTNTVMESVMFFPSFDEVGIRYLHNLLDRQ